MSRGRKPVHANNAEKMRAYRGRQKQLAADAEKRKLDDILHDAELMREAKSQAARILRAYVRSEESIRFVEGGNSGILEKPEDRQKIIRYIVSEANRMEAGN